MIFAVDAHRTVAEIIRSHSSRKPHQIALRFLADDASSGFEITYAELDESARRIASWIQSHDGPAHPIPLIFPAGLDFIRAFVGCLYAGRCAVPLSLPTGSEGARRVLSVLADVGASMALVADDARSRLARELAKQSGAVDLVPFAAVRDCELSWREPQADVAQLALLQYTSGSTSTPKGVEISHRNLVHNIDQMAVACRADEHSIGVSWLPHFHDMGLIGGMLMPLCIGFPVTLMSPASFVRRPLRWLETISKTGATISGAPNFGYEHCLREIGQDDAGAINLASWTTAFCGAEPIRADTIARFAARFAGAGFRKSAMFPCYGLAEATLMVSGRHWSQFSEQKFARSSLGEGRAEEALDEDDCTVLVASGTVLDGHRLIVVDPTTRKERPAGMVGEIWISSRSVGHGYWNRDVESAETFRARLAGNEKDQFLRTGDLGFLRNGQLFVTGRQKDLLIIRGANYYPEDIERALEAAVPALRAGFGAVFAIDEGNEEKLVVVYELDASAEPGSTLQFDGIVATLAREFGLQVQAIALIKRNRIPKTTSGKIKRQQCRSDFLERRLPIIDEWRCAPRSEAGATGSTVDLWVGAGGLEEKIGALFKAELAALLGVDVGQISDDRSIFDLGVDSLVAVQLQNRIEQSVGVRLDPTTVLEIGTIGGIVRDLVARVNDGATGVADPIGDMFEQVLHLSDDEVARLLSLDEGGAVRG
jgi:acyl-CoA synthetase (AMP-forming)/AMP-acid ligase II/acyl carrier protein